MGMAVSSEVVAPRRYRFEGVVVDEAGSRLVVDGRPRGCSQRALRLLAILCQSPGVALSRNELLDRLWPGGQIVADEALTQAVFRARAVLGEYAGRIVTVRGIGFRLDATVEPWQEALAAAAPAAGPLAGGGSEPARTASLARTTAAANESAEMPVAATAAVEARPAPAPPPASALSPEAGSGTGTATPTAATTAASPPTLAPGAPARRDRPRWLLAALLLALAAALALLWLRPGVEPAAGPALQVVDVGYGLTLADLHAVHPDTPALVRDAFANEAAGDRARARSLLEAVHAADPSTPIAALFLGLWSAGGGDNASADLWIERAAQRTAPLGDPYLTTMLAYVRAERGPGAQEVLRHAGAVLDQRPGAWQMRLARAHLMLYEGYRDAALNELARIEFADLEHRKLATALGDRASLGDPDGAEAVLQQLERRQPPSAELDYVRGRIAWSRRDWPVAIEAFSSCVERARLEARFDLMNRSLANLGAIAVIQGRHADAIPPLQRAREGMVASGWAKDEVDMSLMLAQLHALAGDAVSMARELARAESAFARSGEQRMHGFVHVYRQRLAPAADAAARGADPDPGTDALLRGHAAWAAGDTEAAARALSDAERLVAPAAYLYDEVRLLAQRLGLPLPEGAPVDPPYPPLSRLTTRAAIASESGALAGAPP